MSQQQKDQFEQQYSDALYNEGEKPAFKQNDSNKIKDPQDWTTGNEPMTESQRSFLKTLMELHGEKLDDNITKAEAAELIDQKKQNIAVPDTNDPGGEYSNAVKNPENWTTGAEPATGAQLSYIKTLSAEAGEDPVHEATKAEASVLIERLQQKTGRGRQQ